MNRSELRALAHATTAIIEAGRYVAPSGREVRIAESTATAIAGTRLYRPGQDAIVPVRASAAPVIEVTNESSLSASLRLGDDVACLVFAYADALGEAPDMPV